MNTWSSAIFLALGILYGVSNGAHAASQSCGFCPPFYCENVELAERLNAQKKAAAERRGLPKRLSALFDALGNCEACVKTAPDWPHLIVVYDGDALSEYHGREIKPYTTSRQWSAAGEYKARQDKLAGLAKSFHITLGSKPCKCCTAQSDEEYRQWQEFDSTRTLNADPLWNAELQTYGSQTMSFIESNQGIDTPSDLEKIAPIHRQTEPQPGRVDDFLQPSGVRVVQVVCQKCQGFADSYNEVGATINRLHRALASIDRDLSYERVMADYSGEQLYAMTDLANSASVREKRRGHKDRMEKAYSGITELQGNQANVKQQIAEARAKQESYFAQLLECEASQCQAAEVRQPAEPLVIHTMGNFNFELKKDGQDCPANGGQVEIASNNGNPLEITGVSDKGRGAKHMEQTVQHSSSSRPVVQNIVNCDSKKPKKRKADITIEVKDSVTGEKVRVELEAKGKIVGPPKTSGNPNESKFSDRKGTARELAWEPITSKCPNCQKIVGQYNDVMSDLYQTRHQIALLRRIIEKPEQSAYGWHNAEGGRPSIDPTTEEGAKAIAAFTELIDRLRKTLEIHKARALELERQASYLQTVIAECELSKCGKKGRLKFKGVKIGGISASEPFKPSFVQLFTLYDSDWNGPYSSNCRPCATIVEELNAFPGWLARAHMELSNAKSRLELTKANERVFVDAQAELKDQQRDVAEAQNKLRALVEHGDRLIASLVTCEAKNCPYFAAFGAPTVPLDLNNHQGNALAVEELVNCPKPAANESIEVGPNKEVGSKANFKAKAKKKLSGAATKAVANLIGLGGGGGGKSEGPVTYKDPVKKRAKERVKSKKPKREISVGATFTPDGLLVSSGIKRAPGKGTFHSIFLQNPRGWRLMPISLYMYEIWKEWKLNVSWTRDTYIDGEHVKHESGAWSESWKELIAKGQYVNYAEVQERPLWEQLGFNTAVTGAKGLGTLFPVSPAMLAAEPLDLFVHITEPKKDPVVTFPYHFRLSLDKKGRVVTEFIDDERSTIPAACEKDRL